MGQVAASARTLTRPALIVAALLSLLGRPMAAASAAPAPARQVTVFALIATPDSRRIDPRLVQIAVQLRQIKPDCGFQLLEVVSQPLRDGERLAHTLEPGLDVQIEMLSGRTESGKVRLGFELHRAGELVYQTAVTTPPSQLFFCEQPREDGSCLLIGIGAR